MGKSTSEFDGSEVIETKDFVFFWKPPAVFGQWTPSKFVVDGVTYSCAEQYMMAQKAKLFGDLEIMNKIIKNSSPKSQKALGRKVRGFDEKIWVEQRLSIVIEGNMAKFEQNPEMKRVLLATGDKTLVEASPFDTIWGVGLRADDGLIHDPSQWRGKNLLGQALMEVRKRLGNS